MSLTTVLLILALVCFLLATFNVTLGTLNLVAAGLAFWVLALLLGSFEGLGSSTLLIVIVVIVIVVVLVLLFQRGTFNRSAPK